MQLENKVTILGAGSWGLALASVLADNQKEVLLWTIEPEVASEFELHRTCSKYAPNIEFSSRI